MKYKLKFTGTVFECFLFEQNRLFKICRELTSIFIVSTIYKMISVAFTEIIWS